MEQQNRGRKLPRHRVVGRRLVDEIVNSRYETADEPFPSDVQGSYTGVPYDENEEPVQDADDL